jgi:hypothetical protein
MDQPNNAQDPNKPFSLELLEKSGDQPKDMPHSLTKEDARAILVHEQQRDAVGFAYDAARDVVTICGTEFSRGVLAQLQINSAEDVCYQHQRSDRGVVMVTRTHGHRARIAQLIACLTNRPIEAPLDRPDWLEWHTAATVTLNTTDDQLAQEAIALEALIQAARVHRRSCAEYEDDTIEKATKRQLAAAALLWAAVDRIDFIRPRLFLWASIEEPAQTT